MKRSTPIWVVCVLAGSLLWCSSLAAAVEKSTGEPGEDVELHIIDSPPWPPLGAVRPVVSSIPRAAVILSDVPRSTWTYGCSATSAGMIFGYYDRTGYASMYTGPTNGGVCPLTDLGQGIGTPISGSCYIIATMNGFDGYVANGHVDDYWISYLSPGPDPWEGNWSEHGWADCTADYMGTNQWKWDLDLNGSRDANVDGSTTIWSYTTSGAKLYDYIPPAAYGLPRTALCHGLRLFTESRAYTVVQNYTQRIDTVASGGFSFADYMAEIDADRPVMIQVEGHSMVGVGYNTANTVYLHDTWDNLLHTMTWGGSYAGMTHWAMTVIELEPSLEEEIELALAEGWNLVSIPVEPLDPARDTVFPPGIASAVWEYNNPGGYAVPLEIHPKKGYWVLALSAATLEIEGVRPSDTSVEVKTGWNLIGVVGPEPGVGQPVPPTPPTDAIWQYDNPGGYAIPTECSDGHGFWLLASQDDTIWSSGP